MLNEIGQIALAVDDVPRAKAFYVGILGLKPLFDAGPDLSFVAAGPVRIMLTRPEGAGHPGKNSLIYFRTERLDEEFQAIVAKGAEVHQEPRLTARMPNYELWLAYVRDPEGNLIGLMEERR